jgi:hypothetical protein
MRTWTCSHSSLAWTSQGRFDARNEQQQCRADGWQTRRKPVADRHKPVMKHYLRPLLGCRSSSMLCRWSATRPRNASRMASRRHKRIIYAVSTIKTSTDLGLVVLEAAQWDCSAAVKSSNMWRFMLVRGRGGTVLFEGKYSSYDRRHAFYV